MTNVVTTQPSYLKDSLSRRLLFFTGKGGVGKTAIAWATALLCAQHGKRVLFASWSPFDTDERPLPSETHGIRWLRLHTLECFKEYAIQILKFDKLYDTIFDNKVLKTFISAAPGLSETVIAGKIWQLFDSGDYDSIVVDLPASGHALSFFQSPLGVHELFSSGFVHRESEKIARMFQSPLSRLNLVALPEELSTQETVDFYRHLAKLHPFSFGQLHFNQVLPNFAVPEQSIVQSYPKDVQTALAHHLSRKQQEQDAIQLTSSIPLPKLFHPRLTTENAAKTIEDLAKQLETA